VTDFSFSLAAVPPFRLDLTAWVLRRRPHNLMDRWDGWVYRRVLSIRDEPVEVAVTQTGTPEVPGIEVQARGPGASTQAASELAGALTRILGLQVDLTEFYRFAESDPQLGPLAAKFRGFKPPRFPSVFEALVNGIACQQISLTVGIHVLNRLAAAYGLGFPGKDGSARAFPRPRDLAGITPEDLRSLGFSRQKGRFLVELARKVMEKKLDLESLAALDDAAALERLRSFKGVGRWTGEYALLRGLGRWHLFPGDDLGARRRLEEWLQLPEPLNYEGVLRILERWHPYGGLLYFHFLLEGLSREGHLA